MTTKYPGGQCPCPQKPAPLRQLVKKLLCVLWFTWLVPASNCLAISTLSTQDCPAFPMSLAPFSSLLCVCIGSWASPQSFSDPHFLRSFNRDIYPILRRAEGAVVATEVSGRQRREALRLSVHVKKKVYHAG